MCSNETGHISISSIQIQYMADSSSRPRPMGMIPKEFIVSTNRCEPSTVQALCALIRLVAYRLVASRYSSLANSGPSLQLAGMIPKEVIVSTKRCEHTAVQAFLLYIDWSHMD